MIAQTTTCKDCANAEWQLTPNGKIKKDYYGVCLKQAEIAEQFSHKKAPPCITLSPPHKVYIWPRYDATACPMFKREEQQS